jgi:glyoxylase-like metal-dependent hydrolase (beta-lactamase superfamily II)
MQLTDPRSAFIAKRLSASTFLITEYNDVYDERPFIYAKVVSAANHIVIIDTGCGGASKDSDVEVTSLREFIETVPIPDNAYEPLNNSGMKYVVIITHTHYDHIRTWLHGPNAVHLPDGRM